MSWFGRLIRKARLERELDDELRFHLEELTRDLMAAGYDAAEARRRARLELGGVERVKEDARDARGTRWIEDWWQDTRMAFRKMRRAPGFTVAAVLTIAVGVGANTAVFSVIDGVLLRTLPVAEPDELFFLQRVGIDNDHYRFSHRSFERMRATVEGVGELTAVSGLSRMYATIGERPEGVLVQLIDGGWFSLLGVGTNLGRPLGPDDDRTLGGHPVAVLSHGFWTRRFGQDPSIVGRTFRLNGVIFTVIGIAERGFFGLGVGREVDVWAPLTMQHELGYNNNVGIDNGNAAEPWLPQEGVEWLTLVLRSPGDSHPAELGTLINQRFRAERAELLADRDSTDRAFLLQERVSLEPAARGQSTLRDELAQPLLVLMASVGLVLLIACANLASLFVARGSASQHEHAVRLSLGARPGRLARQVLTESITLAVVGGIGSVVVARLGGTALIMAGGFGSADQLLPPFDLRLLSFAFGISLLTGIAFGIAPALRTVRTDLHATFKTGGRVVGREGAGRFPAGRILVTSQVALSLLLATGAGAFAGTLRNIVTIDPGYERDQVVLAQVDIQAAGYSRDELPALYQRIMEAVGSVGGVRSVSLSTTGLATGSRWKSGFAVPGGDRPPDWDNSAQEIRVTPTFFSTVGIPVLRGRGFMAGDGTGDERAVIVSQNMALDFFGTQDVVGQRIGYGSVPRFEIVGVVRDARINQLREAPPRVVYHPMNEQAPLYAASIEARIDGSAAQLVPAIQAALATVDPNLPIREVTALSVLLERWLRDEQFVARMAGVFGGMALLLAGIGLYGVTAFTVSRRINEMGVRLALGAAPLRLLSLVLADTLRLVAAGLALGLILLIPASTFVRHLLYGVSPHDPLVVGAAIAILLVVSIVAAARPAWRAARVDPVTALRAE